MLKLTCTEMFIAAKANETKQKQVNQKHTHTKQSETNLKSISIEKD